MNDSRFVERVVPVALCHRKGGISVVNNYYYGILHASGLMILGIYKELDKFSRRYESQVRPSSADPPAP